MFVNTLKSFEKQHTRSRSFINEVQSNNTDQTNNLAEQLGLEKNLDQEQLQLKQILSDETRVCDDLDMIVSKLKSLQPTCSQECEKVSTPRKSREKKPIIATIGLSKPVLPGGSITKPSKPSKPKI